MNKKIKMGISVSIGLDLVTKLDKQVEKENTTKSAIVCRALEKELNIEVK